MNNTKEIRIRTSSLRKLKDDSAQAAEAVRLKYVRDSDPGIARSVAGSNFSYTMNGKQISDEVTLMRIQKLVIPPAWTNVWICKHADGHLQATGTDTKNRKQYRYHSLWNTLRNLTKFSHLLDFGEALPAIKQRIHKDMALPGLPLNKVLATIVSLMQCTCIRIGSNEYEKLYGSFGLTTLKDKHVKINSGDLKFSFKGKKGVYHDIQLHSSRLARIVKQCRDIPGQELFQYYDGEGQRHPIDSGMVNNYIKDISGAHFTSKDFRTWAGTTFALEAFRSLGCCDTETNTKKKIIEVLDIVAKRLGNTRTVCRKYYVHPLVIDHYSNKTIVKYFDILDQATTKDNSNSSLSMEEGVLLQMLRDTKSAVIAA